jgi:hypothetical protein
MSADRHLRVVPEPEPERRRAQLTFGVLSADDRGEDSTEPNPATELERIAQRLRAKGGIG